MTDNDRVRPSPVGPIAIGFAIGLIAEMVAIVLAILSGGAGHGNYAAARALFPIPMLTTLLEGDTIGPVSTTLALIQFPLLGALTGYGLAQGRRTLLIAVGGVHFLAMLAAFSGVIPNFS